PPLARTKTRRFALGLQRFRPELRGEQFHGDGLGITPVHLAGFAGGLAHHLLLLALRRPPLLPSPTSRGLWRRGGRGCLRRRLCGGSLLGPLWDPLISAVVIGILTGDGIILRLRRQRHTTGERRAGALLCLTVGRGIGC